jgi:aryl-alcohol dehydrogenase-like predicted oxidoreductase
MRKTPTLLLGTAQLGWNTDKKTAFELLDAFYESGFRQIDGATNYPINKNIADFRAAEFILSEWLRAHGVHDAQVMMKIGSLNNLRTPESNLSRSFLWMSLENYRNLFGKNLDTLMIHWDNRDDEKEISETLDALNTIQKEGFEIGLSGILHPKLYAELLPNNMKNCYIQLKNNVLQSDYEKYLAFFPEAQYITYGINAGGLKLDKTDYSERSTLQIRGGNISNEHEVFTAIQTIISEANKEKNRPTLDSFFQIGMIYSFFHPNTYGLLIGNSSAAQWKSTFDFYTILRQHDYSDVWKELVALKK